jgi:hypothetical protein
VIHESRFTARAGTCTFIGLSRPPGHPLRWCWIWLPAEIGVTGSLPPVPAGHRRMVANRRSHNLYKPAAIVEESLHLSRARRSIAKRAPG